MEIWKDIKGFEGVYQVSSFGQIKRLTGRTKGRLLKPCNDKDGYKKVVLCVKGITYNHSVHRLLAMTFIPNPENKKQVNHKNGIKWDNRVENLEWATASENAIHGYVVLKRKVIVNRVGTSGNGAIRNKPVRMFDKNGVCVREFYSVANAVKETGISLPVIDRIVNGRQTKTRYGIKFQYIK